MGVCELTHVFRCVCVRVVCGKYAESAEREIYSNICIYVHMLMYMHIDWYVYMRYTYIQYAYEYKASRSEGVGHIYYITV